MKVIIPNAELVNSSLRSNFGEIYPLNIPVKNGTLLELLVNFYKDKAEKIIILANSNDDIAQYKIDKIVEVKVAKEVTSLATTFLSSRLEDITGKVIINFADTFVKDLNPEVSDAIYTVEVSDALRWTIVDKEESEIKFYDKQIPEIEKIYYSAVSGAFTLSSFFDFLNILRKAKDFYAALLQYNISHPVKLIDSKLWEDYGHLDLYNKSKEVAPRAFNSIDIDKSRGVLTKRSTEPKLVDEILWYLKLPAAVQYIAPRIFEYKLDYQAPMVKMEYYSYESLHNLFIYGDLELGLWNSIFDKLFFIRKELNNYTVNFHEDIGFNTLHEMYVEKTVNRLEKLAKDERFAPLYDSKILINGREYRSLNFYIQNLERVLKKFNLLDSTKFSIVHGDYCFPNILGDINSGILRVIDPRGQFGAFDIYGDSRYDIAKLAHSISGKYDLIIKDLFRVYHKDNQIDFTIHKIKRHDEIESLFWNRVNLDYDENQIRILEGLLFISMVPLHYDFPKRQSVMLATGLEKLAPYFEEQI